jgi:ABC-type transporter Mla subunit MlaD
VPLTRRRTTGALAIIAALAVVTLGYLKPNPFAHQQTVRIAVADAGGLAPIGADVRIAGTPVGKVSDVTRSGDHAVLTLKLDDTVETVRSDARAELRPRLMFEGTAYVDLDPGTQAAKPLGARILPMRNTQTYVSISDALRVVDANVGRVAATARREADPAALQQLLRRAPPLVENGAAVARAARGPTTVELRGALRHLSQTTEHVARDTGDLEPLIRSANRTIAAAATANARPLTAMLRRLPAAGKELRAGAHTIAVLADRIRPLAIDARPAATDLGPTLDAVRPLLRQATPAARDARPLIATAAGVIDALPSAAPAASRALAELDPSLKVLDTTLLPALAKKTGIGLPAYQAFLNLFGGGGGASRPFGVQGDGHMMRFGLRFLTGAGQPLPPCTLLESVNPQLAATFAGFGACTP